jgi:hypothetical protein
MRRRELITSKYVFTLSLLVIAVTILLVYVSGLENHRSLYLNSIYSLSILSVSFFLFITVGLYSNYKLHDDVGKILTKENIEKIPRPNGSWDLSGLDLSGLGSVGDGCGAIIGEIVVWIVVGIIAILFILVFGWFLWAVILAIFAMLYWIFFRALRMVFKMAPVCKDNLLKSMGYGLFYTVLYNCWIYGIIFSLHFLVK